MNYLTTMKLSQCFRVLRASPGDKWEVVKKSYYLLVKQYHPDLHPNNLVYENKLKEVTCAFKVLEKHYKYQENKEGQGTLAISGMRFNQSLMDKKFSIFESRPMENSKINSSDSSTSEPKKKEPLESLGPASSGKFNKI